MEAGWWTGGRLHLHRPVLGQANQICFWHGAGGTRRNALETGELERPVGMDSLPYCHVCVLGPWAYRHPSMRWLLDETGVFS